MSYKAILLLALLYTAYQSTTSNLFVDPLTSNLKDEYGRQIIIHGMNVVYKQFPYYPVTDHFDVNSSLSTVDWVNLQNWGFKAIRLYLSWEGFQPKQGQYNYTYLQKLKQIVQTAEKYDIGVILDVHQDLYSRKFCGEGFPDWVVTKFTFPAPLNVKLDYDIDGIPTKQSCMNKSFSRYYFTDDVMKFAHDFFTNNNGMADKFAEMWKKVAAYFLQEKNVIGYELLNEPQGTGLNYKIPRPGLSNNKYLLPFYKKLIQSIRQIQTNKLILFEPAVQDIGGFYEGPQTTYANKSVLSYHTYCLFRNSHAQPKSNVKCNIMDGLYLSNQVRNIKKLRIGGMLTQFGTVPESSKGIQELKRVIKYAQANRQSWFYWQYKYNADSTCSSTPAWQHSLYYPDGSQQTQKIKVLSHPYAFAICGTTIAQQYTQNSYSLTIKPKQCSNKYTQIFLNEQIHFKNGFQIAFSPVCPQCQLKSQRKGSYQLIVPSQMFHTKLTLKVAQNI